MSTISQKIRVKGKKKSNIKYADHRHPGPEIKKSNAYFNPDAEGNNLYSAMYFVPFEDNIPANRSDFAFAYNIKWFRQIPQGTSSYTRVGQHVRVKQIYLKGYCEVYTNLICNCRVRLYFVRLMKNSHLYNHNYIFSNTEAVSHTDTPVDQIRHMKHNFYKAVLNSDVISKDLTCQKIAEFNLTPYVSPMTRDTITGITATSSNAWTAYNQVNSIRTDAYCLPFQKVLKLNETIEYTDPITDTYDRYGLMMTCDMPKAADPIYLPTESHPNLTDGADLWPFCLNFFTLIYYTDD